MFTVEVQRFHAGPDCTIGRLLINGQYQCFTLEDKVRETSEPVSVWKVAGKTAIGVGTYDLAVDFSSRFKRLMPHVLEVPGFDGIRIHSGNSDVDTEGCLLLGQSWSERKEDWISGSRGAFDAFFGKLQAALAAGGHATITITNEFAESVSAGTFQ